MKKLVLLFIIFIAISCKNNTAEQGHENEQSNTREISPDWLIGAWERTGEKEGKNTYEYWKKNKSGEFIGLGCTLEGKDTIWKEDILLSKGKDGWRFNVTGLGDTSTTSFLITHMDNKRFVCENKLNEFPKKIEYVFDGTNINAVISEGGPTIPFNFRKIE